MNIGALKELHEKRFSMDGSLRDSYRAAVFNHFTALLDIAAIAEELSKRHGWHPDMGQCVCDQHKNFAKALAALEEAK